MITVVHIVSNKEWGGGERYALDICRSMLASGHRAIALVRPFPEVVDKFQAEGIQTELLTGYAFPGIGALLRLVRLLDSITGNVIVHVHNFKDARLALCARRMCGNRKQVKVVCTRHLVKRGDCSGLSKAMYRSLDSLIFVSELARHTFLSGVRNPGKIHTEVIPNAVMAPVPANIPREPHTPFTLIFLGRISPDKGLETLLDAMTLVKDEGFRLKICGTGDKTYLESLARRADASGLGSCVSWEGHVQDIYPAMSEADAGVLPSVVPESFGLALIECMSQGLPVVTTANGAQREIVTSGIDGFLVPPSDARALADALLSMNDRIVYGAMSQAAFSTFRAKYAYEIFFNRITSIYNACLH